jgi:hypothetical protein
MRVLLFFCCILAFGACKPETKTLHFVSPEVEIFAEGPLFEGANTAQGIFQPQIAAFLQREGFDLSKMKEAVLSKATLMVPDSLASGLISEITLQMASDQVDMQNVGVLNPVPDGKTSLEIKTAQKQEKIADLLRQKALSFVADVNLKKDIPHNLVLKGIFEFNITVQP